MTKYTLRQRDLCMDDSWDVIVAGGGPAGCAAAASAAREGARTLLIEGTGALGGMGTSGLVPVWCPFTDKQKIIYAGLAERVLKTCISGMAHVAKNHFDWTPIDPELLKRIYDDLVTEHGATVLFNSFLASVENSGGRVDAIIVSNKSGLSAYRAKIYIDATGDADLAAWAGAEYELGGDAGELQAATHCFIMTNVDEYAYRYGISLHGSNPGSPIFAIAKDEKYPEVVDNHICNSLIGPRAVGFNAGHMWDVDNTRPETVSEALIKGRRIAYAFQRALAEYHPTAFGNAFLAATGSLLGIRETRRIIGDYVLTTDDYVARRSFPDEICRNAYYLDLHRKPSESGAAKQDADHGHMGPGESHGLPYRCLTPRGLDNVLVAGRCISTDRRMQGSTRVMPVCLAMGEAAGCAAAMAAAGCRAETRAVDTGKLRHRLREHGAYLPEITSSESPPSG